MFDLKSFLLDNLGTFSPRAIPGFIFNIFLVALLSFLLGRIYVKYGNALSNRRAFSRNFLLLATTTMFMITVIKSSLALSLGLVGALSIVRFRSAIKEPEELAYLFLNIAIGLGVGAGFGFVTVIALVLIFFLIWLFNRYRKSDPGQDLYLTLSGKNAGASELQRIVDVLSAHCLAVKLKRADESPDTVEYAFLVEFKGVDDLEKSREKLREMNPGLTITFMDNSRDY